MSIIDLPPQGDEPQPAPGASPHGEILARIQAVTAEMQADIKADVERWEGAEFNGRNVSTQLGELSAVVSALAGMVGHLAQIAEVTR